MPAAGCVLNVAEDHLDWHGSMAAYAAAKARALRGPVAVAGVDDPAAAALLAAAPAARKVGVTLGEPAPGQLGIVDGVLVDRAFSARPDGANAALGNYNEANAAFAHPGRTAGIELARVADVHPGGPPGLTDALAAAALARAAGVAPGHVAAGLAGFRPGRHRADLVATVAGVRYVDDSKATNPHAAAASLAAQAPAPVVWVVGGLLKGASVDELVAGHAGQPAGGGGDRHRSPGDRRRAGATRAGRPRRGGRGAPRWPDDPRAHRRAARRRDGGGGPPGRRAGPPG